MTIGPDTGFIPVDVNDRYIIDLRRKYRPGLMEIPWYTCQPQEFPRRERIWRWKSLGQDLHAVAWPKPAPTSTSTAESSPTTAPSSLKALSTTTKKSASKSASALSSETSDTQDQAVVSPATSATNTIATPVPTATRVVPSKPRAWADIARPALPKTPPKIPITNGSATSTSTEEQSAPTTNGTNGTITANGVSGTTTTTATTTTTTTTNGTTSPTPTPAILPISTTTPSNISLGKAITTYNYNNRRQADHARGLVNQGNICFMNSILQVLTHSEHFYSLIMTLGSWIQHKIISDTPILDGLIEFMIEFTSPNPSPYTADSFYAVICQKSRFRHLQRGRQEDAQEFLGMLLECLEEEFLKAEKIEAEVNGFTTGTTTPGTTTTANTSANTTAPNSPSLSSVTTATTTATNNPTSWVEVGKKNKPLQSRYSGTGVANTPIGKLLGGQFKSVLSFPNQNKPPSITYDPFQHVQLDISDEKVSSIEEAIDAMCEPETIVYSTSQRGQIKATKQVFFDILPRVLIVHLKRFTYSFDSWNTGSDNEDVKKITKPISFSDELTISTPDNLPHKYSLFAVVYHHGPSATVGHYTVDVKSRTGWTGIDDISLTKIDQPGTLSPNTSIPTSKTAYLLFYTLDE